MNAEIVLVAPSNPVTSIGPILAVPGVREALHKTKARIAAVSPIVAGEAVAGPAGILMASQGLPVSVAGVAEAYHDFLDMLVIDTRDAQSVEELKKSGLRVHVTKTIMRTSEDKADLAGAVLAAVRGQERGRRGARARMILIPVKNLKDAKQRLASVLDQPERTELARAMLADVDGSDSLLEGPARGRDGDVRLVRALACLQIRIRGHRRSPQQWRNRRDRNGHPRLRSPRTRHPRHSR